MARKNPNPIHMYDMWGDEIMVFNDIKDCAEYCDTNTEYISHNLLYCDKIRVDGIWYRLRREKDGKRRDK